MFSLKNKEKLRNNLRITTPSVYNDFFNVEKSLILLSEYSKQVSNIKNNFIEKKNKRSN